MKTTYNSTIICLESFLAIQRWTSEGLYPQAVLFSGGGRNTGIIITLQCKMC